MSSTSERPLDTTSLLHRLRGRPSVDTPAPRSDRTFADEAATRRALTPPHRISKLWLWLAIAAAAVVVALYTWHYFKPAPLPAGIASSNGRLEATQIDLATKLAGRVDAVLVQEGDFIDAGQVVARMDTRALTAQLHEAEAQLVEARTQVITANATVTQRRHELDLAEKVWHRSEELVRGNFITPLQADTDRSKMLVAQSALEAARSQVLEAQAAVEAGAATVDRIQSDIDDSVLKAPTAGRAQYRLAEPGEVLAAGGRVIDMLDLSDVYMIAFLPETTAGQLRIGAEARIILDAAPGYVIPATVRSVADQAQFTPKAVETASERQKLVFRVKLQLDPAMLRDYRDQIKAGMPGLAYVRVDPNIEWPASFTIRLPPK